jgi:hypothetical protein
LDFAVLCHSGQGYHVFLLRLRLHVFSVEIVIWMNTILSDFCRGFYVVWEILI